MNGGLAGRAGPADYVFAPPFDSQVDRLLGLFRSLVEGTGPSTSP